MALNRETPLAKSENVNCELCVDESTSSSQNGRFRGAVDILPLKNWPCLFGDPWNHDRPSFSRLASPVNSTFLLLQLSLLSPLPIHPYISLRPATALPCLLD